MILSLETSLGQKIIGVSKGVLLLVILTNGLSNKTLNF
jgi:hypothetical protein